MIPSPSQQAIYDWIEHGSGNALVDAVAGAGKTTVLIEGARRLTTTNARFVAFNKIIAEEIASRLQAIGSPMQASTIHSLGKGCLGKTRIERNKYTKLCRSYLAGLPDRELVLKATPEATAVKHLRTLVNFTQLTLASPTEANLLHLAQHYALDDLLSIIARNGLLWETLWTGVSAIIAAGIEQYQRQRLIDFNDMVYLPTVLGLPTPQFDFLLIDEAQDLNRAQLELVLACKSPNGRMLFVGDQRQCQPAGTMVQLTNGSELPIEQLQPGSEVITLDRRSPLFVKKGKVAEVAVRHYEGLLYTIQAGHKQSHCTHSHKWLVRWAHSDTGAWVTYLMRQGNRYRVGQCRLFENGDFELSRRMSQERADAAWILKIHQTLGEALAYEALVAAKYHLPRLTFTAYSTYRIWTTEAIHTVYTALAPQAQYAERCLHDHGRSLDYPLCKRENGKKQSARGKTKSFEVQACNLIPDYMQIPACEDAGCIEITWQSIEIMSELSSGSVYSLNVEEHHSYIADGLVTLNSIYGFAAADTESIQTIITRTQASVLPLSICYRCPSLPIQLAQQIYPAIQPAPTAERGIVGIVSQAEFVQQVQPDAGGCAVLGRCTAPLVSLCLKLLQQGKKAKVRGRDIGAGILDLVERLSQAKRFRFAAFLELLDDYRDAQLEVLGEQPENEMAVDAFLDKVETVVAFYHAYREETMREEAVATIEGFASYITDFFSDEDDRQCILFSTIHKAKGLEFNVVYVLPEKVPHPLAKNAWQYQQELNAEYVLLTRAKVALYFLGRLISNLHLPPEIPAEHVPEEVAPPMVAAAPAEPSILAEAEALWRRGKPQSRALGAGQRSRKSGSRSR